MITINTSSTALFTQAAFGRATEVVNTALERLATGKRINSAEDDPSGLIAAEGLRADVYALTRKIDGLEQSNLSLGATEGQLGVVQDAAIELKSLIVRAGNRDALGPEEQDALQAEISSLVDGIERIQQTSEFKGARTLTGLNTEALQALREGGDANAVNGDLEQAEEIAESFASDVSSRRAAIGAKINSNTDAIDVARVELESTAEALSQIEDTDFAREISELIRGQTLQSAALATQTVAQQQAEIALGLLQSAVAVGGGSVA